MSWSSVSSPQTGWAAVTNPGIVTPEVDIAAGESLGAFLFFFTYPNAIVVTPATDTVNSWSDHSVVETSWN